MKEEPSSRPAQPLWCPDVPAATALYLQMFNAAVVPPRHADDRTTLSIADEEFILTDAAGTRRAAVEETAVPLEVYDLELWRERAVAAGAVPVAGSGDGEGRPSAELADPLGRRWRLIALERRRGVGLERTCVRVDGSRAALRDATEQLMTEFDLVGTPADPRLVMLGENTKDWGVWEKHVAADEVIYQLSGAVDLVLDGPAGRYVVELRPGTACIVPRGTWHRGVVHDPGPALFIMAGGGTVARPVRAWSEDGRAWA